MKWRVLQDGWRCSAPRENGKAEGRRKGSGLAMGGSVSCRNGHTDVSHAARNCERNRRLSRQSEKESELVVAE
jgi:hypothetical protein